MAGIPSYHHVKTLDHFYRRCCCAKSCHDRESLVEQLATPREAIGSRDFGVLERHYEAAQTQSGIIQSDKGQWLFVWPVEPQVFAASEEHLFFEQGLDVVDVGEVRIEEPPCHAEMKAILVWVQVGLSWCQCHRHAVRCVGLEIIVVQK